MNILLLGAGEEVKNRLAALRFFWNRMVKTGIVLLHDYFHPQLPGIKRALAVFETNRGASLLKTPIGDLCSIAISKT